MCFCHVLCISEAPSLLISLLTSFYIRFLLQIESALSELREEDIDRPLGNPHLHEDSVRVRPAAAAATATAAATTQRGTLGSGANMNTRHAGREEGAVVQAVDFKSSVMGDRLAADAGERAQEPQATEETV